MSRMCSDANTAKENKQMKTEVMLSRKLQLIMTCHHDVPVPLCRLKVLFEISLFFALLLCAEETGCQIICGAKTTLMVKGYMRDESYVLSAQWQSFAIFLIVKNFIKIQAALQNMAANGITVPEFLQSLALALYLQLYVCTLNAFLLCAPIPMASMPFPALPTLSGQDSFKSKKVQKSEFAPYSNLP